MDSKNQYSLRILRTIGVPLMGAVLSHSSIEDDLEKQASVIAGLLSKSVEAGIVIGDLLDIGALGEGADAVRAGLTAVASRIVANYYQNKGQVLSEAELQKIKLSLQAVLTFSDNFSVGEGNVLEQLDDDGLASSLHYLDHLVPVVSAVQNFAFGKTEAKLLAGIADRVNIRAKQMAKKLSHDNTQPIFRALCVLYADCYNDIVRRMTMPGNAAERASYTLDKVWENFDEKADLLEMLSLHIAGESSLGGEQSSGGGISSKPLPEAREDAVEGVVSEPDQSSFVPQQKSSDINPMSMFAKKPQGEGDVPLPADENTAEESLPPSQPPVPPQDTEAESPADSPKPAGNPMSFFKNKGDGAE